MTDLTINDALARRRTVRDFSDEQIPLEALKRLAWAAQGITSSDGKRTAPSAHALHPLELFCLPNRVEGLSQSLYQFDSSDLDLRHIDAPDDLRDRLRHACIDAPSWITQAACIVAVCADMVAPSRRSPTRGRSEAAVRGMCIWRPEPQPRTFIFKPWRRGLGASGWEVSTMKHAPTYSDCPAHSCPLF